MTARLWTGVIVVVLLAAAVAVDLALGTSPPGLTAAIGLFGGLALILGAKRLVSPLVRRDEDYYDRLARRTAAPDPDAPGAGDA